MTDIIKQSTLLAKIRTLMRDPAAARWSSAEIYEALSIALLGWQDKVSIPLTYAIPSGFNSETYTYTLPSWITPPFHPMTRNKQSYQVPAFTVQPGTGGWTISFGARPPDAVDSFVIWNYRNDQLPPVIPTLGANLNSTAKTVILNTIFPDLPNSGYIRIDDETMFYTSHIVDWGQTHLTIQDRAVLSAAVTHNVMAVVEWCVVLPRADLYNVLLDETRMRLHEMYLTNGSPKERDFHQQMIGYFKESATAFWKAYYSPVYSGRMRLTNIVGLDLT